MQQRTLNLGILAHVDAGKTTLTERLLYAAGVIHELGSVDKGSTQTDFLALERQRGITIRSAVVSFEIEDLKVNLIDTPGHPDFIAEVDRVLSVLDGAVLITSAVEGVQPQTRILMRALQRLHVPTIFFVNKIDRTGAGYQRVLEAISERLTPSIVPMGAVRNVGTKTADFAPYPAGEDGFRARMADALGEHNDSLLASYLDEGSLPQLDLWSELATQTKQAQIHPVFFGSAATGAGVGTLTAGIAELLPPGEDNAQGPLSGQVFKIERGRGGDKIAYLRIFSGSVRVRDRLALPGGGEDKITSLELFERGDSVKAPAVTAGQIAKVWGLGGARVGDRVGVSRPAAEHHFAPPTLETVVVPRQDEEKGAVRLALGQLAEQDPLINLRQDDTRHEIYVSLYGEVQKEVIQATLAGDYGLEVDFRETTVVCIERPVGTGSCVEILGKEANPFLATVGLRVDPAPPNSGIDFQLDVKLRTIPMYVFGTVNEFRASLENTVRETLGQGLLGWQVTDCRVTLTESGYSAPGTSSRDFRLLLPLVLMHALTEAGTIVCEPINSFQLEIPAATLRSMLPVLAKLGAVAQGQVMQGSLCRVEGDIRAARVHTLRRQLAAITHGEGVLESEFHRYEPVQGTPPARPRSGPDPLNRERYLLHLSRRMGSGGGSGSGDAGLGAKLV